MRRRQRPSTGRKGDGRQVARAAGGRTGARHEAGRRGRAPRNWPRADCKAIEASDDPMIQLARLVDKPARQVRTIYEQQVEEPQRWAYGKLANARFALFGADTYPDATFTLRLSVGTVKGYEENGVQVPVWTTLAGLYRTAKEHDYADPFNLPKIWLDRKRPAESQHAAELHLHRRHHRRQLGQPGGQPRGRIGRHRLRRQHPVAGLGLHLHRNPRPLAGRPRHARFSKRCGRSTTPARWPTN